jgi:hypothetical protein
MRVLAGLFLVAHGLVHLAVWLPPFDPEKSPFDPRHSWLFARGDADERGRSVAVGLAWVCAAMFVVAGIGVLADLAWGGGLAIAGAAVSLLLTVGWFHRWLAFNVVINVAIIVIAAS